MVLARASNECRGRVDAEEGVVAGSTGCSGGGESGSGEGGKGEENRGRGDEHEGRWAREGAMDLVLVPVG